MIYQWVTLSTVQLLFGKEVNQLFFSLPCGLLLHSVTAYISHSTFQQATGKTTAQPLTTLLNSECDCYLGHYIASTETMHCCSSFTHSSLLSLGCPWTVICADSLITQWCRYYATHTHPYTHFSSVLFHGAVFCTVLAFLLFVCVF